MRKVNRVRTTKKTAALQRPKKAEVAAPSLEIRYPLPDEGFCLTGNIEHRHCLILDGPGLVRLLFPVESSVLPDIFLWAEGVLLHHAVSESGKQFAIPEIRDSGNGRRHPQARWQDEMFQEQPGSWMGLDYTDDRGECLFMIGMDHDPHAMSRQEYAARLEQTLAPWVIDSANHPWIKYLMDDPTALKRHDTFREGPTSHQ